MLIFVQCQTTKKNTVQTSIDDLAKELFGEGVRIEHNSDNSVALFTVSQETDLTMPGNALEFGIYDVNNKKLLYREQKYNAKVSWYNDKYIKVKSKPGVKSLDPEVDKKMRGYYINVLTLEKTTEEPN